jgi:hypothetical protein
MLLPLMADSCQLNLINDLQEKDRSTEAYPQDGIGDDFVLQLFVLHDDED